MMSRSSLLSAAIAGGAAGLIATLPMTLAMRAMFQRLPRHQQYPLPPRQIVTRLACSAGAHRYLDDDRRRMLARVSHFGYGTAMGTVYGVAVRPFTSSIAGGAAYGLAIWAGSYLGWLPAAGILPPATQMPRERNLLMIAAHLVWGGCLALLMPSTRSTVASTKPLDRVPPSPQSKTTLPSN